ncbi:MAG TPA: SRPBCC family protein [Noviherbaspirillum sp.]|nr:SRPBCC family protein [Noviherbaspirillum sp.]
MVNKIVAVAALAAGGIILSKQLKKSRHSGMPSSAEQSIEVDVPVSTAYNQWTQFEDFPKFMESVHEVRQLDDTHLHWRATVAGKEQEWDAEITEQIPDKRIAWRSITGVRNSGVVTFHKISDSKTRIMLQMDYEPRSIDEKVGDTLGLVKMQAKRNLDRFKEMLESRGSETGAWRGSVAPH